MLTCVVATSTCEQSTLTLTPVAVPTPPRWALGCGAGWRTAQRTTWAAVPHWPREDFTDGQRLDAQPQTGGPSCATCTAGGPHPTPKLAKATGLLDIFAAHNHSTLETRGTHKKQGALGI